MRAGADTRGLCRDKQQAWAAFALTTHYLGAPCRIQAGSWMSASWSLVNITVTLLHAQVLRASPFLASLTLAR